MAVAFDTILQGAYSGIEDQVKSVIGDQDAWAELWARHNAILHPPPALPDLDFANEMIVCLYAGQQGSGGYTACIRSIEDSEDGRRVSFELGCPPPGAMCTDALTQPHHLVRMPRTTLPVSFREVVAPVEVATSATFLLTFDPAKKEEATQKASVSARGGYMFGFLFLLFATTLQVVGPASHLMFRQETTPHKLELQALDLQRRSEGSLHCACCRLPGLVTFDCWRGLENQGKAPGTIAMTHIRLSWVNRCDTAKCFAHAWRPLWHLNVQM
ncbi:unnamed protein product [Effrenium voratum]|uniref:PrcB C-terminal domain-containing protein n=1 Tax=Effrenium voratum TaxID=2562239 RepID=A0AA36J7G0_9DINO|nr:unnamed protein product [Effrenium voratum]